MTGQAAMTDVEAPWRTALRQEVALAIGSRDRVDWMGGFAHVACCVEPVLTPLEALNEPQVTARGMVVEVPLPDEA